MQVILRERCVQPALKFYSVLEYYFILHTLMYYSSYFSNMQFPSSIFMPIICIYLEEEVVNDDNDDNDLPDFSMIVESLQR